MSKKIWTVVISLGMILAMSITSMAAYTQHGYNSGTKTETVYVYAGNSYSYSCTAKATVVNSSNSVLGYHDAGTKVISGAGYHKAEYKCVSSAAHHGIYDASAQNTSVPGDHFTAHGSDY